MGPNPKEQLIRDAVDAYNRGDVEWILENTAPEFELVAPVSAITGRSYRGARGLRQWMRDLRRLFEEWDVELHEVEERHTGEVFARGTIELTYREGGERLESDVWYTARFDAEGRLCSWISSVDGPALRGESPPARRQA